MGQLYVKLGPDKVIKIWILMSETGDILMVEMSSETLIRQNQCAYQNLNFSQNFGNSQKFSMAFL